MQITELGPGGKPWDEGDPAGAGKPDIAVCIRPEGHHRCYPGGARISGPACADSFDCDVDVEVRTSGEFDAEVWDADESVHDLISKGQSSFGERCHFGRVHRGDERHEPLSADDPRDSLHSPDNRGRGER